jgi:hypothetical protein
MSFVSKGEKKVHNMAKGASKGANRDAVTDSFGKRGQKKMRNEAPGSMDKTSTPVSDDADGHPGHDDASKVAESTYDPASGKRAKSVADLRSAQKKLNERAEHDDGASPTGSEGGQDAKHTSSSKNASGYMKAGEGEFEKKSGKKPRSLADVDGTDDMEDPMDEDEEDSGQYKDGMTPSGTSRKKVKSLKDVKNALKLMMGD